MALPRLLRTSSFRLTVIYAGLFAASVLLLFAIIYEATSFYMTASLDAAVDSDITELTDSLRNGGMRALAATIDGRVREDRNGPMYYRLANPADGIEAGNLPWTAHRLGRFDVGLASADTGRDNALRLRARGLDLSGGAYLLVGIDAHPLDEMHELILRAFGWGSAITLVLAFGGGALLSGGLLRRVEAIARAARDIMSDDFSRRLPTRGTDDEFDHLVTSLNAMLDQTQAAVARVRQVSDDIAHDLRTPLTRLRQHLEQAQHRARSVADWRDAAAACITEMDAILETFGALLRIAQIERGVTTDRFTAVDLSTLLATVAELYEPMADEKRQHFAVDVALGLIVWGDRELLAQMVANVVENAMKHSPEGAAIGLTAAARTAGIEIVVADNGPGIPEAERDRVFTRFYRLESSRSTAGSGLGLSLVQAIAAQHRATIDLSDNRPGLRFRIRFAAIGNHPGEPRGSPRAASLQGFHYQSV